MNLKNMSKEELTNLIFSAKKELKKIQEQTKEIEIKVSFNKKYHIYTVGNSNTHIIFTYVMIDEKLYVNPILIEDISMRYCNPIVTLSHKDNYNENLTAVIEKNHLLDKLAFLQTVDIKYINYK